LDLCVATTNFRVSTASDFARCVSRIQFVGVRNVDAPDNLVGDGSSWGCDVRILSFLRFKF
jgi:hypothetical protein